MGRGKNVSRPNAGGHGQGRNGLLKSMRGGLSNRNELLGGGRGAG